MTATTSDAGGFRVLPDYAPVPLSAFGPALNDEHHADHAGAASLFGDDVVRIGHRKPAGSCCGTTTRPGPRPR